MCVYTVIFRSVKSRNSLWIAVEFTSYLILIFDVILDYSFSGKIRIYRDRTDASIDSFIDLAQFHRFEAANLEILMEFTFHLRFQPFSALFVRCMTSYPYRARAQSYLCLDIRDCMVSLA